MKAQVIKYKPETEFFIDEQCYINELSNNENDEAISIAKARVKPGISTHWHRLKNTVERYLILQGNGLVEIGDSPPQQVEQYDVVIIPVGCRQRITNTAAEDLIFLALCSPRFDATCYEDIN